VYSITSFRIGVNPRVKASDPGLRSVKTVKNTCGFERLSNRQVAGRGPGLDGSRSLASLPRERRPKWLEETGICLQELAETCKGQGVAARILSQRMSQSGKGAAAISAPFAIPYFKSTYLLRTGLEPAHPFGHQPLKLAEASLRACKGMQHDASICSSYRWLKEVCQKNVQGRATACRDCEKKNVTDNVIARRSRSPSDLC
jgi:hypothetical protein